ncbi:hypothetical protein ACFPYM_24850, partial [Methylobacterium hispanicum]
MPATSRVDPSPPPLSFYLSTDIERCDAGRSVSLMSESFTKPARELIYVALRGRNPAIDPAIVSGRAANPSGKLPPSRGPGTPPRA